MPCLPNIIGAIKQLVVTNFSISQKKKKKVSEVQKDKFIKERDLARRIFLLAALLVSLTALRYHNI